MYHPDPVDRYQHAFQANTMTQPRGYLLLIPVEKVCCSIKPHVVDAASLRLSGGPMSVLCILPQAEGRAVTQRSALAWDQKAALNLVWLMQPPPAARSWSSPHPRPCPA